MSWSPFLVRLLASITCNFIKKRGASNTGVFLWILQTLWTPISKNICKRIRLIVVIYCIEKLIKLFRSLTGPLFLLKHKMTLFYLLSLFAYVPFIAHCHSLSLIAIFCYSLSLVVIRYHLLYHSLSFVDTRCHFLSLVLPFVVTRHSLYHSLSFVVTRRTTRCPSSFIVPLVVICCHSLYHSLSFIVSRCTTRLSFYKRSNIFCHTIILLQQ